MCTLHFRNLLRVQEILNKLLSGANCSLSSQHHLQGSRVLCDFTAHAAWDQVPEEQVEEGECLCALPWQGQLSVTLAVLPAEDQSLSLQF